MAEETEQSEHTRTWWTPFKDALLWLEVRLFNTRGTALESTNVEGPLTVNEEFVNDILRVVKALVPEDEDFQSNDTEFTQALKECILREESYHLFRPDGTPLAMITGYAEDNAEVASAIKHGSGKEIILYVVRDLEFSDSRVTVESDPEADPKAFAVDLEKKLKPYVVRGGKDQNAGTETRTFLSKDESKALELAGSMPPEDSDFTKTWAFLGHDQDSSKEHTPEVEQYQDQPADLAADAGSQHEERPASEKVLWSAQDSGSEKGDEEEQVVRFFAVMSPEMGCLIRAVTITKVIVAGNAIRHPTTLWRRGGSDID
jgi:hypothetical protein